MMNLLGEPVQNTTDHKNYYKKLQIQKDMKPNHSNNANKTPIVLSERHIRRQEVRHVHRSPSIQALVGHQ